MNQIRKINKQVIKELHLDKKTETDFLKKLSEYKYVDEMDELKYGAYIRWIPINEDPIPLTYSGIVCDIKITNTGVIIACKNFKGKHFSFRIQDCMVFQKLKEDDILMYSILD